MNGYWKMVHYSGLQDIQRSWTRILLCSVVVDFTHILQILLHDITLHILSILKPGLKDIKFYDLCENNILLSYGWSVIYRRTDDTTLQWRHNERNGVSNHRCFDCLFNRLFRRRSKKTSKLRVTGRCEGIHRWLVNSPHKGPVTRKMCPFDDVIVTNALSSQSYSMIMYIMYKDVWKNNY